MINCSGFKVWPAEVEAMLYAHPAIQEACVIGSRDAYRGETVKAVVVLKSAREKTSRQKTSSTGRARRWRPSRCRAWWSSSTTLPKTATGKIFWRKLQEEENRKVSLE